MPVLTRPEVPRLACSAADFEHLNARVAAIRNELHMAIMAIAFPGLPPQRP